MPTPHLPPHHPRPAELDPLRRLITHPLFPVGCIFAALVITGARQWAHL